MVLREWNFSRIIYFMELEFFKIQFLRKIMIVLKDIQ
jgi:hypothetical protein